MKKATLFLIIMSLILALLPGWAAGEGNTDMPGAPFPDISVTDTEGNTFCLSEALNDHEAVLINLWATWCHPCISEFPRLEEAWKQYGDRVAFIALSGEPDDTMEKVAAFRQELGVTFPMGLDENLRVKTHTGMTAFPQTIIVDRFGNVCFWHIGIFMNAEEIGRVLDCFLGESYTETSVLKGIPVDASTRVYPVSGKRAVHIDNENVKTISIRIEGVESTIPCYVVPDEKVHIRLEIGAKDNPFTMTYQDLWGPYSYVTDMYDPERGAYVYDQVPEGTDSGKTYPFSYGRLAAEDQWETDPEGISFFLIRDEQDMEEAVEFINENLGKVSGWEYAEAAQNAENAPQAYIIHVVDQDNHPVEEVTVNFCTDFACVPKESDENGLITFEGAPDVYHVQLTDVPEGYSFDESFELYTDSAYGEWVLRVRKD